MTPARPDQAGFSLLEMLVGLTLLALISVAVTQSVRTGLRLWQAAEANDGEAEWQQTEWLVEQWLSRALSPREFELDSRAIFEGRDDGVSFLVDGQVGRKPAGYSKIMLEARENPVCLSQRDLVLVWEDVSIASNFAPEARDERVLAECADQIVFDYRRGEEALPSPDVYGPAAGTTDLPRVVQIRFVDGGKQRTLSARLRYAR